jgi:hypothetical protein
MSDTIGRELNSHLIALGIALELPFATGAEAGSGTKRILHELHVSHLAIFYLAKDREGRSNRFAQFCRCVGETSEDSDIFAFAQRRFRRE